MDIVIVTHKDQQSIRVFAKEIYTECDCFDEKKILKQLANFYGVCQSAELSPIFSK